MDAASIKGQIDFGLIMIREDEFEAVLARFPTCGRATGRRQYNLSRIALTYGGEYLVAMVRCFEQGNGEAQAAAHDILEDLDPAWLLVVGIAGGVPSDDFTLGDVVVSTRVHDFSVEAVIQGCGAEYALAGGPTHKTVAALIANLPALKVELGNWNSSASLRVPRPVIEIRDDLLYGDNDWRKRVRHALSRHVSRLDPLVTTGAVASSDRFVKDTELLAVWLKMARHVLAIEMESAGVYRATHGRQVPTLTIRGISDIVGFRRDYAWTNYACHVAAAFASAWLRTEPTAPRNKRHCSVATSFNLVLQDSPEMPVPDAKRLRSWIENTFSFEDIEVFVAEAFPEVEGGLARIVSPLHNSKYRAFKLVQYFHHRGQVRLLERKLKEYLSHGE